MKPMKLPLPLVLTLGLALLTRTAAGAEPPDTAALWAAQRQAMQGLSAMDGVWRGTARIPLAGGGVKELVQTERVGPMLGGTIKVVEGRGYAPDGALDFHAFGVVSFSPRTGAFTFQAHAQGQAGSSSSSRDPTASSGGCAPAASPSATRRSSATAPGTRSASASSRASRRRRRWS